MLNCTSKDIDLQEKNSISEKTDFNKTKHQQNKLKLKLNKMKLKQNKLKLKQNKLKLNHKQINKPMDIKIK